jgi:hypothetical protein
MQLSRAVELTGAQRTVHGICQQRCVLSGVQLPGCCIHGLG